MSVIGSLIKKGKGLFKGKKGKKGNPGNPGTSGRRSRRRGRKAIKAGKENTTPQNAMSAEIGGEVKPWDVFGNIAKVAATNATQKIGAMNGLVSNNPKLFDTLKNITGSTNIADFAAYFAKVPPAQQQQMIVQSRTETDIDQPPSTIDKIFGYASNAADIYRNASGADDATAMQQKKQKNVTLIIIGAVVISVVVALIFLLKTKKKIV